jgi:hypothetical protein
VPSTAAPSPAARGIRPVIAAAAAAGVIVAAAGCSSSSSSSAAAGSSSSASPSASVPASGAVTSSGTATAAASSTASGASTAAGGATGSAAAGALPTAPETPQPAASGQLTGTQLESVLLPASDFPSGYTAATTGPVSSGSSLTLGVARYDLSTVSCTNFVEHLGTAGFGESAMASDSLSAAGKAFDEFLYQFPSAATASAFVSGIGSLAGRCASFQLSSNGVSATFKLAASAGPAVGGHPATQLTESGKVGGEQVSLDLLLCADGVDAFGVAAVGAGGAAPPTTPARPDIMDSLMKRQAAAALLG